MYQIWTARSLVTAKKVTNGLRAEIPLIVYNGAFIVDNLTGEVLAANYFDESVGSVLDDLFGNQIFPIVYARIDGKEKFSYVPELVYRWYEEVPAQQTGGCQDECSTVCGEPESGKHFLYHLH
ncbi:HAD hydrolase family protein [Coprococcus eutactus]|uniref:HAD hydrolase family protein n=1 Tax=Coprococcus eutactus TaxID=33043 RepID=UPI00321BE054